MEISQGRSERGLIITARPAWYRSVAVGSGAFKTIGNVIWSKVGPSAALVTGDLHGVPRHAAAKLKHIFWAIGDANPRKYFNENAGNFELKVDVIERWMEVKDALRIGFYSNVRMALFFIGSLLIVIAKWREGRKA